MSLSSNTTSPHAPPELQPNASLSEGFYRQVLELGGNTSADQTVLPDMRDHSFTHLTNTNQRNGVSSERMNGPLPMKCGSSRTPPIYEHPLRLIPVPLPEDFYKVIVEKNGPTIPMDKLFPPKERDRPNLDVSRLADQILRSQEDVIVEAANKLAASTTPDPVGPMFHGLLPVDFEEGKFIKDCEQELERQRQAAAAKVVRRST